MQISTPPLVYRHVSDGDCSRPTAIRRDRHLQSIRRLISDLGAQLAGGLGLCAVGKHSPRPDFTFRASARSRRNIAGKGIANPLGSVLASGDDAGVFWLETGSGALRTAVRAALRENYVTPDLGGDKHTFEVGDWLAANPWKLLPGSIRFSIPSLQRGRPAAGLASLDFDLAT